ncbi:MAG: hypothetical protein ACJAT7_003286 [Psychromonas sp.]|jgi:hypothetical protein
MDVFSNLSQYRDVLSEVVRKKVVERHKNKKTFRNGTFWLLFLAVEKK